ncbi:hypothetical protein ATANTOWER_014508 [Ataeniobius toweri]|uniref:BED-type domain-containing protein n=1 Tax=Ataeniobius toweri TaxID=208326 RepID=A0ABU7B985_9TELE|nr:hypothetical protein [Ataeniobius toweri]
MNTALHTQQRNDVSSCWYHQQSMADRKRLKVWLQYSKCNVDYARCNICDAKCKAISGNTLNLRKHLVKHKIFLKAEECTQIYGYNSAFGTVSTPASVSDSLPAASNTGEEMFETTEMLQYSWMLF